MKKPKTHHDDGTPASQNNAFSVGAAAYVDTRRLQFNEHQRTVAAKRVSAGEKWIPNKHARGDKK